jgi:hypothetical protein
MDRLSAPPIEVMIVSITPVAEYAEVVHTQQIQMRRNDRIWSVLDSFRLVGVNLIGQKCLVELAAVFGTIKRNPDKLKGVEFWNDYGITLYGEIKEASIVANTETAPPSNDVEILLGIDGDVIRCGMVYWPGTDDHELQLQEIRKGRFVKYTPGRLDLETLETA